MRKLRCGLWILSIFCVCGCVKMRTSDASAVTEADFFDGFRPITLGPVTTFERTCANCHGPQGSFYGPTFAELDDAKLAEFVEEMMTGPASLSPTQAELEAMTAYNRTLAAGKPFICIADVEKTDTGGLAIRGECSPDATLTPVTELNADGTWRMHLAVPAVIRLEAVRAGMTSSLLYPPEQWTGWFIHLADTEMIKSPL